MLKTVRQSITRYNMLTNGDRVVVGISGGADSVVLLSVLIALKEEWGLSVFAVHINHNLRNLARHDEEFVRLLCEENKVPLAVYQADVKGLAGDGRLGIEESGRKLRYQYLHLGLEKYKATKIAMGHHADDNTETVLLNLFRGAGLKGLCGIPPVNGRIIRPLLEVSRKDIEAYAYENNLRYVTDETNAESDYSRNYVRNKLVPVIKSHFGDGATASIARNAMEMRADEAFLSVTAKKAYDVLADGSISSEISLPINKLLSHPPAIAARVIRHAIATLRGKLALNDIQHAHVQSILDIANGRTGREVNLPGFTARREYVNLVLLVPDKTTADSYCVTLSPGIPVYVQSFIVTLNLQSPTKNQPDCTQAFNYDKLGNVLELRTRRPGDKIILEGVGTKKLQDYFTDTKTPKGKRDKIPLLADGSNILWIMDKHNRINTAYKPINGQKTCWVTVEATGSL